MIIIIDNYDSFTYNLYQAVARFHPDVRVFRNDKISVDEIRQLNPEGIILSPGPGRPETAGICVELIQALASEYPILGVCLGHQAITVAYGGKVIQCNEIVHGKSTTVTHDNNVLFQNMSQGFQAARYHSLIAEKSTLPETLKMTAENDSGLIMAIKHQDYPCYGIQFHPESILTPEGLQLINNFIAVCIPCKMEAVAC